jgi:hypothetical protein
MSRKTLTNDEMIGKRFGGLVVLSLEQRIADRQPLYRCQCDCGGWKIVRRGNLISGNTQSCGCRTVIQAYNKFKTPTRLSWRKMIERCTNPNDARYHNYGGRGITVCPEWFVFENFSNDMGERPSKNHTLDRIDNTKGYCKENCRWATFKEQNNNRRDNVRYTVNGRTQTLSQWADELGVTHNSLSKRHHQGYDVVAYLELQVQSR